MNNYETVLILNPVLSAEPVKESIYKKQRFSDHAPLIIDYDYIL